MTIFQKETYKYFHDVFLKLAPCVDIFNTYDDFAKFTDSRYILRNHVLFTILTVTSEGISDALQFIGSDNRRLLKEISASYDKLGKDQELTADPVFNELDQIYNGFISGEDLAAIMSYKSRFNKHCDIPVYIRQSTTQNQLIQKYIGFYAEDYIRFKLTQDTTSVKYMFNDDYWYAAFHFLGFKAVFNKLYNLDISVKVDDLNAEDRIIGEFAVFKTIESKIFDISVSRMPIDIK